MSSFDIRFIIAMNAIGQSLNSDNDMKNVYICKAFGFFTVNFRRFPRSPLYRTSSSSVILN